MKHKFKLATGTILLIIAIVWTILIYIQNPDMTEMRLLLTFWKEYIGIMVVLVGGFLLVDKELGK